MSQNKTVFTENKPIIAGTGLISLDIIIKNGDLEASKRHAGGTCGNVLTILSYLGWEAYPISRLNDNAAAKRIFDDFKRWGVNTKFASLSPQVDAPIIIQNVIQKSDGSVLHKFSLKCPHCRSWLPTYKHITIDIVDTVKSLIPVPKVFFLDRLSRGILNLAQSFADKGAIIVFEPSGIENPKLFAEALKITHILKYSNERIQNLEEKGFSVNVPLEIETMGKDGLRFRSNLKSSFFRDWQLLDTYKVNNLKDAAGAGDWCSAGIIYELCRDGLTNFLNTPYGKLYQGIRFGQALGAWNCGFEGARSGMYETEKNDFWRTIGEIMSQKSTQEHQYCNLGEFQTQYSIVNCSNFNLSYQKYNYMQDACCF
jgi:fructokinase